MQVSQYTTEGLERAQEALNEAAALRERFMLGTSVSRRVMAAAAAAVSCFHRLLHKFSTCNCRKSDDHCLFQIKVQSLKLQFRTH